MAYLELLQNDMKKKNGVEFFIITGLRKSVLKTKIMWGINAMGSGKPERYQQPQSLVVKVNFE